MQNTTLFRTYLNHIRIVHAITYSFITCGILLQVITETFIQIGCDLIALGGHCWIQVAINIPHCRQFARFQHIKATSAIMRSNRIHSRDGPDMPSGVAGCARAYNWARVREVASWEINLALYWMWYSRISKGTFFEKIFEDVNILSSAVPQEMALKLRGL